jgi:hypothetical protein
MPPSAEKIIKQLNYGTAVGLTKTAKEGQAAVVGALKGTFTLRGTWFNQNMRHGIKITPATPRKLQSEVKTLADWLEPHETGRDKTPRGKSIAVPTTEVRRNKRAIIPRAQRPKGLGAKAFVLQTKKGPVLAQRITRGKRKGLVILYGLEPRVKIKKRSTFREPIQKVVDRRLKANILREIRQALAVMR